MTDVTQEDRDAEVKLIRLADGKTEYLTEIEDGCYDENFYVQAFARHRINTRPASAGTANALADTMPGHWDTEAGAEIAREYLGKDRVDLAMGDVSDIALANAQYLVSRESLKLIDYQTAAKERIRWLSTQLAALTRTDALACEYTKRRVKELIDDGDGFWRACSGCQESSEGCVSIKDYPYSDTFRCQPGSGCGECGGTGVIWDDFDYNAYALSALEGGRS